MHKGFLILTVFVLLIACNFATPSATNKANTTNIKLIGHVAETNATTYEISVPKGIAVSGSYAYVAIPRCTLDTDDGRYICDESWLRVIDVSNIKVPTEATVHPLAYPTQAMTASDEKLYIGGWSYLRILDMADPLLLQEIALHEVPLSKEMHSITLIENYLYISGRQCITENNCSPGLWTLNVSDIATPKEINFHAVMEDQVNSTFVTNNYALVVQVHRKKGRTANEFLGSLWRIDRLESDIALTEKSALALQYCVEDISVSDNYIYIAYGQKGLQVIDITDPTKPREVGFYNTTNGVWGVATNEARGFLYIVDSKGAMSILKFAPTPLPVVD